MVSGHPETGDTQVVVNGSAYRSAPEKRANRPAGGTAVSSVGLFLERQATVKK